MCTSLIRPSPLERLPTEILQLISDVLDDVSAVCLKNTNSTLRSRINRDSTSFSRCTKWLIMCRFESDLLKNIPWERQPEKVTCAFCKVKRTKAQIIGRGSGRKGVSFSTFSLGRWHVPSTNRYCAKHPVFITWVKPAPGHHVPTTWVMTRRLTCSHCEARVDSSDARITGCAECQCDVCPRVCRALFTRYGALPKAARAGRPYIEGLWWQTDSGKVYISEFGSEFTQGSFPLQLLMLGCRALSNLR